VVAPLVLAHRTKRTLFDEPRLDASAMAAVIASVLSLSTDDGESALPPDDAEVASGQRSMWDPVAGEESGPLGTSMPLSVPLRAAVDKARRSEAGKTQQTLSSDQHGRYVRSRPASPDVTAGDVALDASVRQAAATQALRPKDMDGLAIQVDRSSLHEKVRTRKVGASIVFCVDTSGSMGAARRISAVREAVRALLVDAYERRDRVAVVSVQGQTASVVLAPTASAELAQVRLRDIPTGGATPLASGILTSLEVLAQEKRRQTQTIPWLVVVTDGRANVGIDGGLGSADALTAARRVAAAEVNVLIVDASGEAAGSGSARELAVAAGAECIELGDGGHVLRSALLARTSRT
jgi:magnesium chelatase subunit D